MILPIEELAKKHAEKLSKIKVCLFDVDGILTDGHLYWSGKEVGYNRVFHTSDGYGLKILAQAGIKVGIISGGNSIGVKRRFTDLGVVEHLYLGNEDKRTAYLEIKEKEQVEDENILYMGDEFFDMPLLKKAGFSATVESASKEVREVVDHVCLRGSGKGCVREVIEILRTVQDFAPEIPDFE